MNNKFAHAFSESLRQGDEPGDVLVRSMQRLDAIEKAYDGTYGGLVEIRTHLRNSADHTEEDEVEVAELMRQIVLLTHFLRRREQTTINEIVPGAFPISDVVDGPSSSMDWDCSDSGNLADAICLFAGRFWPIGTIACGAAQLVVAIACS